MEPPTPPAQKAGCMVRTFIIILPLGLSFMVPMSLWIYYQKKHQPAPATSQYAAMLRKDLDAADFARYARILSRDIGERSLAKPDNLDAAASFIESTMGYDNMGYAVQRQGFEAHGKPVVNLVAELPGKAKAEEVVLVLADYDDTDTKGISALMCLAHALAGTGHSRTIRFAAVTNAQDLDETANGVEQLARADAASNKVPKTLILVAPLLASVPQPWTKAEVRPLASMLIGASEDSLAALQSILSRIEAAADAP